VADRREVAVELVTRTKPKGFRDLEKETNKAAKNLQKFGRKLTAAFGLTKLTQFLVKSVKAFAENEKALKRLNLELENVNLGFASGIAADFIRNLSLATGITDDELNPALQRLIRTTYTLTDAQKLLTLAVDISKRTGKDLSSIVIGLEKAYLGQTTALAKLNIGYTTATLKGKDFDDILADLQKRYAGGALATQDSFATSIDRLKVAFDEAKEALGEGFVKGLTESGVSVEEFQKTIIKLGEDLGTVLGKAASGIKTLESTLENLSKNPAIKFLLEVLDWLIGVDPSFGAEKAANAAAVQKASDDAIRKSILLDFERLGVQIALRREETENAKLRAAELKRLAAAQKKAAADKKRTAEIERLRNAITYKFDIDAINQQAALRRNISADDKDRLLQLIALKITDYQTDEEAIKTLTAATTGKYTEAMALEQMYQLLKLAGFAADKNAITALEKLDPKITFKDNLDEVIAKLKALIEGKYTINIGVNMPGLNLPVPGGQLPERPILPVTPKGEGIPIMPRGPGFGVVPPGVGPEFFEKPGMVVPGFENTLVNPQLNFQAVGGGVFETKTTTGGGLPSFLDYLDATPGSPGFGGRLPFGVSRESIVVNVNAAGSIISQNDLVTAVTDAVYQTQRTGNPLLLSEV
jgi:hypothetical protein